MTSLWVIPVCKGFKGGQARTKPGTFLMYPSVLSSVYIKKYKPQTTLTSSTKTWSMRHHWEQPLIPIIFMRWSPNDIILKKADIGSVLFTSVTSASSKVPDT